MNWHYEDYYSDESCRSLKDGDEMSGHPNIVTCEDCLARMLDEGKSGPQVGMGATFWCWTDRFPGTVVNVLHRGKTVWVQEDDYKRIDKNGMSEMQQYEYTRNPKAPIIVFTLRKNGRYVEKGGSMKQGYRCSLGYRNAYHDFSF